VPAYNEAGLIGHVVQRIKEYCPSVVVVDDGSTDASAREARRAGATVIEHKTNKGKGIAQQTGFDYALSEGLGFVVTLDADGQHDPAHIPAFVESFRDSGAGAVIGNRMWDPENMPFVRRMTNRYMSWLLSRRMGQRVPDTQCGYRLYGAGVLPVIRADAAGFAAESEALLRMAAAGHTIASVPITVIYGEEESKIRPCRDTIRFFAMLRRFDKKR